MIDFATIGLLATIGKTVVDTFNGVRDLLDTKDVKRIAEKSPEGFDKLKESFTNYQKRLQTLSLQLERCETLTRLMPTWFETFDQIPIQSDLTVYDTDKIAQIWDKLNWLIHESVRDSWSATFFRTKFDQLPNMNDHMTLFRGQLETLDNRVRAVPSNKDRTVTAIGMWPSITNQLHDLRNTAINIQRRAEDIRGELIHELQEAAQQTI